VAQGSRILQSGFRYWHLARDRLSGHKNRHVHIPAHHVRRTSRHRLLNIGNLVLYFNNQTLVGVDVPSGQQLWSFAGNGDLSSAPLIVNQTIYIGSSSGTLYGLNTSGQQIWSTQVGAPIPFPDEGNAILTTGLGSGDGLLIVPTESVLVAYGPCNGRCAPTPRRRPTPAPRP
jgi:outer membrane protein assembly factor BamB